VYYAPDVLRGLWYVGLALLALCALLYPVMRFIEAVDQGNLPNAFKDWQFYIAPLGFALFAIAYRLTLESIGVLFDILAELRKLNSRDE
jgi:hypothetical protein